MHLDITLKEKVDQCERHESTPYIVPEPPIEVSKLLVQNHINKWVNILE